MKYLFISLGLFFCFLGYGQTAVVKNYDWDEMANYNVGKHKEEKVYGLFTYIVDEYTIENGTGLVNYELEHVKIYLNSDEKIEEFNKVYIPVSDQGALLRSKARVINSDGSVITQSSEDIIKASDEESGRDVFYFAFEGISKGSIIEYFYAKQAYPDLNGSRTTLQEDYPQKNVNFNLIYPNFLDFKYKSYNGLASLEPLEIAEEDSKVLGFEGQFIEALYPEEVSFYRANLQFLVYNLDKNYSQNIYDISSYSSVVRNSYKAFYSPPSKAIIKKIKKVVAASQVESITSEKEKIRAMEDYLKDNYVFLESGPVELSELSNVLDKKAGTLRGIMSLYINVFEYLGIESNLVFTSDRRKNKFDPDFESYNFLDMFLLYFPSVDAYMSPTHLESKLGYLPFEYIDNHALVAKSVKVGDLVSAIGEMAYIEQNDYKKTYSNMDVKVSFDKEDMTKVNLEIENSFFGYVASFYQNYYKLMDEEGKRELSEALVKFVNENLDVANIEVLNPKPTDFGIKPYVVKCQTESAEFVERAGPKYLLKVGEFIGPQSEMYQETERKMPVDSDFNRSYDRIIEIDIPEGYTFSNLEDLNSKREVEKDGEVIMYFESSYEKEGQVLKIKVDEYYDMLHVPLDMYEDYRAVINSAADFNKVVLVLEKQ